MEATVIRTDSGVVFRNAGGVELRGTLVRITRDAIVFEVYSPYAVVEQGESLASLTLLRDGYRLYSGGAVVESVLSTGMMLIITATPLGTWAAMAERDAGSDGWADTTSLEWNWEDTQELLPDVQIAITSIRSFLDRLSRWVAPMDLSGEISRDGNDRVEQLFQTVQPRLLALFSKWEKAWQEIGPDQTALHRQFAQRELHPLMLCSPFVHRTYTKPLGYAGDYEMVNMLLRNRMEGPSTYAKIVNSSILRLDLGEAHRNRIDRMVDYLVKEARRVVPTGRPLRVLNLGCGPAHEIERFIRDKAISDECEFTLLDFNAETIEYTRRQLDTATTECGRKTPVRFLQMSINDLLREAVKKRGASTTPMGEYDFVYCAGLFDYMSDKVCRRLLEMLSTWTAPGGFLMATNVHPRHRIHAVMEDLCEWHLIMRTESEMLSLTDPELGSRLVNTEATGVNVFLEIRKRE
ncbi:MAG TPA: class I SAM-dependent methyltransferase [Tepidisphaeraceae bacterium]|jgi:extracellular factor (EF) 3-hydroxypalmitic acid methyl ester biosynthesis protein